MKVPASELDSYIESTIQKINDGLFALRQRGISVEMPDTVQFQVEVVHLENGFTRITQNDTAAHEVETVTQPGTQVRSTAYQFGAYEIVEERTYEEAI